MSTLFQDWIDAKTREQEAAAQRRELEDQMVKEFSWELGGSKGCSLDRGGYIIKITHRIDQKVDGEKLQEIARENGLSDHLSTLFRWKPEINMSVWKATDESITGPLLDAVTSKKGRPSFSIVRKEV